MHQQELCVPITLDKQIRIGDSHMAELDLNDGDIVIVESKNRRRLAARCFGITNSGDHGLSTFVFTNRPTLGSDIGDDVGVRKALGVVDAQIVVLDSSKTHLSESEPLIARQLKDRLMGEPICVGETFSIARSFSTSIQFAIRFILGENEKDGRTMVDLYDGAALFTEKTRLVLN